MKAQHAIAAASPMLVCLPLVRQNESVNIPMFFKQIMFSTQFDQNENCDYVAQIINYLNSTPVFSVDAFEKLLMDIDADNLNIAASKAVVGQQKPVQPQSQSQSQQPKPMQPAMNVTAAEAGFYKEQRTATVTIQEHNFETSRVVLTMNATDNGNPASAPTISGWSGSGDTHTATISFASDAVYTWTLAYTDKAGNKATDLENQSFCVDLTKPAITISGINPNSANNTDGNIGFAIECTDTNFGTFTPVLTAVVYENGSFATKEIEGSASSVGNGERIEYGNLEEDGMYSLRCAAVDKAGNAYDTVNIVDEDGVTSTVNLQDGDNLIDFSVNRNGSTFALNDYSMDVVNDYYVQETAEDIVFYETNADELLNYNIKLNGNALKEGNDYKVTESGGDGSWYRYEYAVNK